MAALADRGVAPPGPGEVEVFTMDLGDSLEVPRDPAHLSDDERLRAARFLRPADRARSVAARRSLRRLLGGFTGLDPAALAFVAGDRGKPALAHGQAAGAPAFNVAHSGRLVLLAFATCAVGVDVEEIRPGVEVRDLAQRFFSAGENEALGAAPLRERPALFFRIWTRKEAYVKALGTGLAFPLEAFTTTAASGEALATIVAPDAPPAFLLDLAPRDGYAAAVVTVVPARLVARELPPEGA